MDIEDFDSNSIFFGSLYVKRFRGSESYHIVQYKKGDVIFIANVLSYFFTKLAFRLIIPAMVTMMLSVRLSWAIGIVVFKILNFFRRPITRSTWILTRAIYLDMSISLPVVCFFPLVNAVMRSTALLVTSFSSTKKARSANRQSTWVSLSRKPDFRVISLSKDLSP